MEEDSKSYPLPTQSLPGLNYSDHIADLVELTEFFAGPGISTQNTRIERYIQYLKEFKTEGPKNESLIFKNSVDARFKSSLGWLLYVLREIHELMWILRGLKVHIPKGLNDKLKLLVSGSDFAALDTNPHSRNIQFELRIASYFCQAGFSVDLSTSADVVALNDKYAFFVECKRVGSISQVQRRLTEAAKQLKRKMRQNHEGRIVFGCIAVDVTKAAFSHNGLTWGLTSEHTKDIIRDKLIGIANLITRTPIFLGGRNIIQYWLQIHIPSIISHPPATITTFSSYYIQNPQSAGEAWAALKLLRDISAVANKPDEREIPPQTLIHRHELKLPAGSTFRVVDESIVQELLNNGSVAGKRDEDVIAELNFDGKKHEFQLFDLQMLVTGSSNQERESMKQSDIRSRLEIILKMYMRRYPYENIDIKGQIKTDP